MPRLLYQFLQRRSHTILQHRQLAGAALVPGPLLQTAGRTGAAVKGHKAVGTFLPSTKPALSRLH